MSSQENLDKIALAIIYHNDRVLLVQEKRKNQDLKTQFFLGHFLVGRWSLERIAEKLRKEKQRKKPVSQLRWIV